MQSQLVLLSHNFMQLLALSVEALAEQNLY